MKKLFLIMALMTTHLTQAKTVVFEPQPQQKNYHVTQLAKHGFKNELHLLNNGMASLQKRVELIENAQKYIDVEYYIFKTDKSGMFLLRELAKAARRGVKVRILVDHFAVLEITRPLADVLMRNNIEVRYYNNSIIAKFSSVNFRNHKKMLVADGKEAIIGGRNIGDDYFNLSSKYNFLDRDVHVKGPMARVIHSNFEDFWNDSKSKTPKLMVHKSKETENYKKAKDFYDLLQETSETRQFKKEVARIGKQMLAKEARGICPDLTFASDKPGANFRERIKFDSFKREFRILKDVIAHRILNVKDHLFVSSTYMIHNAVRSRAVLKHLLKKDVKIQFFTNSLNSTDALHVASAFYSRVFQWTKKGIEAFVHAGYYYPEEELINSEAAKATWGTHAKTMVFDKKSFMIGSYNIDNRSAFYNTEVALFCRGNQDLTDALNDNINERLHHTSLKIVDGKKAIRMDGVEMSPYSTATDGQKFIINMLQLLIPAVEFLL